MRSVIVLGYILFLLSACEYYPRAWSEKQLKALIREETRIETHNR